MVTLVYAFLLCGTHKSAKCLMSRLLRYLVSPHRKAELDKPYSAYHMRFTISRLWQAYPPARLSPALQFGTIHVNNAPIG